MAAVWPQNDDLILAAVWPQSDDLILAAVSAVSGTKPVYFKIDELWSGTSLCLEQATASGGGRWGGGGGGSEDSRFAAT